MLDICNDEITDLNLHFNATKSVIVCVGPFATRTGFDLADRRV